MNEEASPAARARARREMIAHEVQAERARSGDRAANRLEKMLFKMADEQSQRDRQPDRD